MTDTALQNRVTDSLAAVAVATEKGKLTASAQDNLSRWLTEPQYTEYVPQILSLIEAEDFAELDRLFWEVIAFGTGGRRGPMGEFGSATINARTIAESAHGLAVYVKQQPETPDNPAAVIAYDSRNRSQEFAKISAVTLAANGYKVYFFKDPRSTPALSFAVRHLNCSAGVMLTASHNPPSDNGFKAYWSTGAQVLPPHDSGIIGEVYKAGEIPTLDFDQGVADDRIVIIGEEVDRAYLNTVVSLSLTDARDVHAVFSPLHGVGKSCCYEAMKAAGFEQVTLHEPHCILDGNFPNVADHFPNPERHQVFEPLIAQAEEVGATLVLASDPDADRLGVAVQNDDGEFTILTGNQTGALITDYILRKRSESGSLSPEHFVVETLVTTPLTKSIASSHDVKGINNLLVGFKWIAQVMDRLGPDKFVFGTEESIGFLAGDHCRDKDAGVAALMVMETAADLKSQNKTLLDRLDELYVEHGYHAESQVSKVCPGSRGKEQIDGLMNAFRQSPPEKLADIPFASVRDYGQHETRTLPANVRESDLPEPNGNLLMFDTTEQEGIQFQIAVRPSGTEPKIKFYFFAQSRCESPESLKEIKTQTASKLQEFEQELSNWVEEVLATV